jgi:hypothetical protein
MDKHIRTKTDNELEELASHIEGTLDFFGTKGLSQADWDYLNELVDNCQSCGYYVRTGELNENGDCWECEEYEREYGANDNEPD